MSCVSEWEICLRTLDQGRPFFLIWEPHLRWLHIKYEWSLNILEVLSWRCRGGNRMVMSCLYCTLLCSEIHCQLCVWCCHKLCVICIVPCLQYRNLSCHWHFLYQVSGESVESGELLLSLYRNLFVCNYYVKLVTTQAPSMQNCILLLFLLQVWVAHKSSLFCMCVPPQLPTS
jgi:hypothetical protein